MRAKSSVDQTVLADGDFLSGEIGRRLDVAVGVDDHVIGALVEDSDGRHLAGRAALEGSGAEIGEPEAAGHGEGPISNSALSMRLMLVMPPPRVAENVVPSTFSFRMAAVMAQIRNQVPARELPAILMNCGTLRGNGLGSSVDGRHAHQQHQT